MKTLDVITIGRSSVDLYGAQIGGRLEDTGSFRKYIGGSPTKNACGTPATWIRIISLWSGSRCRHSMGNALHDGRLFERLVRQRTSRLLKSKCFLV